MDPFLPVDVPVSPRSSFSSFTSFAFSLLTSSRSVTSFKLAAFAAAASAIVRSRLVSSSTTRSALAFAFFCVSLSSDWIPLTVCSYVARNVDNSSVVSLSFDSNADALSFALASDSAAVSTTTAASFAMVSASVNLLLTASKAFFVSESAISLSPAMFSIASARSLDIRDWA